MPRPGAAVRDSRPPPSASQAFPRNWPWGAVPGSGGGVGRAPEASDSAPHLTQSCPPLALLDCGLEAVILLLSAVETGRQGGWIGSF